MYKKGLGLTSSSFGHFDERICQDEADTGYHVSERGIENKTVDGFVESIAETKSTNDEQASDN